MSIDRRIQAESRRPSGNGPSIRASGRLRSWRGVDLVTAAVLAVAFGVVFWAFDTFVYPGISVLTAGFPPVGELALGVWLVPAVAGALVIRRPGAAIFTEMVAANVELFLGNQWGPAVLLSGFLQGVGVEIVFAIFLWRRFGIPIAMLGGAVSAMLEIAGYEWWSYVAGYSWAWKFIYLASGVVSGALIAGLLGWGIVRSLSRARALNAFPPGQELHERLLRQSE